MTEKKFDELRLSKVAIAIGCLAAHQTVIDPIASTTTTRPEAPHPSQAPITPTEPE